jgi:hypothetical protein
MKTKLKRLKARPSGRIDMERLHGHEVRLGIGSTGKPVHRPTVTVYPSPYVTERVAHFGADALIANNAAYDAMCERNDAVLAGMLEGAALSANRLPRTGILMND